MTLDYNINMIKEEIVLQPSHIKVYNFIKSYIDKKIVSPDVIEIANGVKYESRHVHRLVDDLVALGFLSKLKFRKRSIKIVRELK